MTFETADLQHDVYKTQPIRIKSVTHRLQFLAFSQHLVQKQEIVQFKQTNKKTKTSQLFTLLFSFFHFASLHHFEIICCLCADASFCRCLDAVLVSGRLCFFFFFFLRVVFLFFSNGWTPNCREVQNNVGFYLKQAFNWPLNMQIVAML